MRFALPATIILVLLLNGVAGAQADKPDLNLRQYHGWGRLPVGSWRLVRSTRETFDAKKKQFSISKQETKTTLIKVDDSGFTLRTESTIEVAGRQFVPQPKTTRHAYYLHVDDKNPQVSKLENADLFIAGLKVPCEVRQVIVQNGKEKRVTKFHICPKHAPFVLKSETVVSTGEGNGKSSRTDVDVLAIEMPYKVLANQMQVAFVRTMRKLPENTTVTFEVYSESVPGGVVRQSTKVLDKAGMVIERRTTEIIDYGSPPAPTTKSLSVTSRRRDLPRKKKRRMR